MVWRRRKVLFFVPLKEELRAPEDISEDQSASIGIQMDIQNILARIPSKQRVCMVLHFVEGFKYKEIAASLGISEEAVRKRVTRGSQEFKRLYNSEEVG
jgi:RNA polymerase sigma-70 factor (ECF subfamily)